ncbi:GumC family protein [Pseudomonadota bacterium]
MNDASLPRLPEVDDRKPEERRPRLKSIMPRSELLGYWHTARRYKWSILGVALLGALMGFLKATSETPIYQASLTLLIEPTRAKSGSVEAIMTSYTSSYRFYKTQTEIIRSRAIAERIAAKLDPEDFDRISAPVSRGIAAGLMDAVRNSELIASFNEMIGQAPEKRVQAKPADTGPEGDRFRLAGMIRGGIEVEGGDRSQIVKLRYESPDPGFAAAVVNHAAEAYIELSLDTRLSQIKVANSWLNDQIEELRKKVAEAEARLQAYQTRESLVDTERLGELTSSRLTSLNAEVTAAQVKVYSLQNRYGEKHPAMVAARAELAEARQRMDNEKSEAVESQSKSFQLAKLERDVATYRQLYDQFLTRFKETDLAMRYDVNDIRVIDPAEPPAAPIRPNKKRVMTTWAIIGLVLGLMLAWLRDFLDNTFKSPHDVEQQLALPVLGVVPYLDNATKKRSKQGKDAPPERFYIHNLKSGFAESVNHIRTSILYTDVDSPPRVIMVTSAIQSEGKTTLSTNLALSFAQLGKTLLVDADLRKPRVAAISGLASKGGLADVVAGQMKADDCYARDEAADNLYIMKSGTQPPNPLEMLSSEKFARLLSELRSSFDHVIVDSPPILPVSDAIVLGSLTDACILAVRGEHTNRSASVNALNTLQNSGVNVIGVALTQVQRKKSSYYTDGYYGYYGEYYGHKDPTPSTA